MSCRRLMEFHPEMGPLWWLCARMVSAIDPAAEAQACVAELEDDATPSVLAEALSTRTDQRQITLIPPAELAVAGLNAVDPPLADINLLVPNGSFVPFLGDFSDSLASRAKVGDVEDGGLVLVEAVAAAPPGVLVRNVRGAGSVRDLVDLLREEWGVAVWAVAGRGRVFGVDLFLEMSHRSLEPNRSRLSRSRDPEGDLVSFISVRDLERVIRPTGACDPKEGLSLSDCLTPEELKAHVR